ncbi:hypothetical protein [Halostella litorea]|uniref:hypothetical protein n=1 Tax=Halostella litorea TaxID=2528831 RepID=UPI001092743D|nr:hypothetical protein [Halostella litorea]
MGAAGAGDTGESSDGNIASRTRSRNRLVEWVLVDGNRLHVTAVTSAGVFAVLLACHHLGVIAFTNPNSVTRMASGMVAGSFSLVTIVVSVNQLILSQEFSPAGEFRDRLEGVLSFRRDVEDETEVPAAPAEPTRLLELVAENVRVRANGLADAAADIDDEDHRELTVRYARGVRERTEEVDEALGRKGANTFDALSTAVDYDDGWQLYAARHLRNDAPALSEGTRRAFDDLIEAIRLFSTAQGHFKTVYLQRELTRFSQLVILFGLPAIGAAALIGPLYGGLGGATVPVKYLPYAVAALATVVSIPVSLLASYILRTATLTRRTAAIGPMLPKRDADDGPFTVTHGDLE